MNTVDLLTGLKTASTSSLALCAYAVVITAWIVRTWMVLRPQQRVEKILEMYSDDKQRLAALKNVLDREPPAGLPKRELLEWVRVSNSAKNRLLLLIAYLSTLVCVVLVFAMAFHLAGINQAKDKPPVLIDSSVER